MLCLPGLTPVWNEDQATGEIGGSVLPSGLKHPWSRSAVYDASQDKVFLDSGSNNNGEFVAGSSWPDTYQALPPDGSTIMSDGLGWPLDSYTPDDYLDNEAHDQDMASGGMQLLPVGINKLYPHLGVIAGRLRGGRTTTKRNTRASPVGAVRRSAASRGGGSSRPRRR